MFEWLETVVTVSPVVDLLRLAAVPVFGWAAYRDVNTRRVPNRAWLPLAALGVVLLVWEAWQVSTGTTVPGIYDDLDRERYFLRVALSLGLVGPVGYLFYWFGGFGGADAKALIVLAVVFPTFPTYYLPASALPMHETTVGVFSLTILTNTVLVGAAYPVATAVRNAATGHVARPMLIGKPVRAADVTDEYGSLLQTPDGYTRRGLDLDALRMYLQWRGCSLADLRADPETFRDPASLPADPNPPGDGSIRPDDPPSAADDSPDAVDATDDGDAGDDSPDATDDNDGGRGLDADDDPWGAAAFLDDIEGDAYGTTPERLRGGLEVLVSEDVVWFSPGLPFIVPMFLGLVVSLVYGDLFTQLLTQFL